MKFIDKDLVSVQEARVLITNAVNAKSIIREFSQEKLDDMLNKLHNELKSHFMEISEIFVNETGYGDLYDETEILNLLSEKMITYYKDLHVKGVDNISNATSINIPMGVVLGILSKTNPLTSAISIIYASIKSGNSVILTGENEIKNTIAEFVKKINDIADNLGFPKGIIGALNVITDLGNLELINSKEINVIINSGVDKFIKNPNNVRYIYGSNGASPVFIDRTANIKYAISEIIKSRSFNNGIMPASEQFIIVDSQVIDEVKKEAKLNKAYFMNENEEAKLVNFLFKDGNVDLAFIGKPAPWLAKMSGFDVPLDTKVLISEQKYISDRNYYAKELKVPVLVMYVEKDWINGCERCMELLIDDKVGHTLAIYSNNESVIEQFIITKPVGRIIINGSTSFGGMGITTSIVPSGILGALTCNKGMCSNNLEPNALVYARSIGRSKNYENKEKIENTSVDMEKLEKIFVNILKSSLTK